MTATQSVEPRQSRTRTQLFDWRLLLGLAIVLALLAVSLFVGQYDILNGEDGWRMFAITRIPRTVALVLAGAAMAMSGLVMASNTFCGVEAM